MNGSSKNQPEVDVGHPEYCLAPCRHQSLQWCSEAQARNVQDLILYWLKSQPGVVPRHLLAPDKVGDCAAQHTGAVKP